MLLKALTISLISMGFWVSSQSGYLLEYPKAWVQTMLQRIFGRWSQHLEKPLVSCPLCMASAWSLGISITLGWFSLLELPLIMLMACAINALILSHIKELFL